MGVAVNQTGCDKTVFQVDSLVCMALSVRTHIRDQPILNANGERISRMVTRISIKHGDETSIGEQQIHDVILINCMH